MSETRPVSELHPHDRADLVPPLDHAEYEALMADIEANGTQVPLDILFDGTVLDGRTRLMIARALWLTEVPVRVVETPDPVAYMIRMAIMRRHLTIAQRKTLAAHLLRQEPERSDRSIAKATGIHHQTVAVVRDELVEAGDVAKIATRTDSIGRKQPAVKVTVSAAHKAPETPVADGDEHVVRDGDYPDFSNHILAGAVPVSMSAMIDARLVTSAVVRASQNLAKHDPNRVAEAIPAGSRNATAKRLKLAEERIHAVRMVLERPQ